MMFAIDPGRYRQKKKTLSATQHNAHTEVPHRMNSAAVPAWSYFPYTTTHSPLANDHFSTFLAANGEAINGKQRQSTNQEEKTSQKQLPLLNACANLFFFFYTLAAAAVLFRRSCRNRKPIRLSLPQLARLGFSRLYGPLVTVKVGAAMTKSSSGSGAV